MNFDVNSMNAFDSSDQPEYSSLNPIYSEFEIKETRRILVDLYNELQTIWQEMLGIEETEIKQYKKKKGKKKFEPSVKLLRVIENISVNQVETDNYWERLSVMIETNIAIVNGKKISEIKKESQDVVVEALFRPSLGGVGDSSKKVDVRYTEFVKSRAEYWKKKIDDK